MAELVQHNFERNIVNILETIKNPQELFPEAFVIRGVGITIWSATEQRYYVSLPCIAQLFEELFEKLIEFPARPRAA